MRCWFLLLVVVPTLAACGSAEKESSPGAAERYLDNVTAHEPAEDRAAAANGMDRVSPSSGHPDAAMGVAPVYSREPVPPH